MRTAVRLYLQLMSVALRSQMQYRASFTLAAIANFLTSFVEFCGLWALFWRFGTLRGWTLPEVALLYGQATLGLSLCELLAPGLDYFDRLVRSGDFDRILLRPAPALVQVAPQELNLMRLGRLAQGAAVLIWAVCRLGLYASPARLGLLAVSITGTCALFCGIRVLQATLCFWTIESLELANILTYGGIETAQHPLSIYRPGFRWFFTWVVPLACVVYFPSLAVLGRVESIGLLAAAPLVGFGFLAASCAVWRVGVWHYTSTGS